MLKIKIGGIVLILITDSDDQLNKAHVKYLESRLIEIAMDVSKVRLENGNCPPRSSLTEAAKCNMEGFLSNILLVLPTLRIDCFTDDKRPKPTTIKSIIYCSIREHKLRTDH